MRLFAIADLHLSFARPKPMHVFGEQWRNHEEKIATAWRSQVADDDIVLVPGDLSWAMRSKDVLPDLAWLQALPGQVVLVKGNHDYWFPRTRRKRSLLFDDWAWALYRNAHVIGEYGFVGGRGVTLDTAEVTDVASWERDLEKQLGHVQASIADLDARADQPRHRIALLHYPPTAPGKTSSPFTDLFEAAGVELCVYGHLHSEADFAEALQGTVRGVCYCLTSADFLAFRLLELTSFLNSGDE